MVNSRSEIRRHPERGVPEQAALFLAAGRVAHVAFVEGEQPIAVPFGYQFDPGRPDRLYLHGSPASRALRLAASGAPLCVTVTILDGLVYSKTALNHSMNYRSVVCFGRGRQVTDHGRQQAVYAGMVGRYFPGRTAGRDYAPATPAQLDATLLVEVEIEECSAKTREGGPTGPADHDAAAPGTCGVAPL
ncbi:MAG: pyridoxamine 5'-phosphate oxidase family protein [Acidobacteriia bacterium]|nr:pyridoxamine 5'-phosphate oxidase family protein [Terriglobia bacterium]